MITCPNCGRENADHVRLCSFCDHELRTAESFNCPTCGKLNALENEVCPHCGTRLKDSPTEVETSATGDDPWSAETGSTDDDPWSLEGFREEARAAAEAEDAAEQTDPPPEPASEPVPDLLADLPAEQTLPDDAMATLADQPASEEETLPSGGAGDAFADLGFGGGEPPDAGADTLPGGDDLRDFFGDLADEPGPASPVPSEAEPDQSDWLRDSLASDDQEAEVDPVESAPSTESERPDWLADTITPEEDMAEAPEPPPAEDVPDWLAGATPAEQPTPIPQQDLPGWLTADSEGEEAPAREGELPDWLAADDPSPASAASVGDTPDWLQSDVPAAGQPPSTEPEPTPILREDLTAEQDPPDNILDALREDATQEEAEPEREGLDWLTEDLAIPAAPIEPEKPAVVSDNWLDEALGSPPDSDEDEQEEAQVVGDDWLDQALGTPSEVDTSVAETEVPEQEASDDMPDWLRTASAKVDTGALPPLFEEERAETIGDPATAPESPDLIEDVDDMPDWLRTATTKAQTGMLPPLPSVPGAETPISPPPQESPFEPGEPDAETPDWLREATSAPEDQPLESPEPEASAAELPSEQQPLLETDSTRESDVSEEDMPDWLRAMEPESVEAAEIPLPAVEDSADTTSPLGDLFDWLDEETASLDAALTPFTEEESEDEEDIDVAEPEEFVTPPVAPLTEALDLQEGELPEWLKDLRPAEAESAIAEMAQAAPIAPPTPVGGAVSLEMLRAASILGVLDTESETREENIGPLKGVMGAVAASPLFATLQQAVSGPAQATIEVDSAQIALLEEIVSPEVEDIDREGVGALTIPVGRLIVTLLLLAAVVLPIAGGIVPFPTPNTIEVPAADAARSIASLRPSPNVIVAFEYDPSQAGELGVEAETMLRALMARNATLYVVSTQPTGPALAQPLLESVAVENRYVDGEGYVNLGYVSGEAAGVRGLVTGVTQGTVSPLAYDYQGNPTDFGNTNLFDLGIDMIVVLAGRPQAVRMWVEQAGNPSGIPMVAAVSASAEPLTLPYYHQGRQLEGMVSGLSGAARFTLATQGEEFTPAFNVRWNAQIAGTLAVALALLVSLIVQLATGTRRSQERP